MNGITFRFDPEDTPEPKPERKHKTKERVLPTRIVYGVRGFAQLRKRCTVCGKAIRPDMPHDHDEEAI